MKLSPRSHVRAALAATLVTLLAGGSLPGQDLWVDDFERADGPVDGWTVGQGTWDIVSGELTTVGAGAESWVWAGDPPVRFEGDLQVTASLRFGLPPGDAVGRHGGLCIFASQPTWRGDAVQSGYLIDWIDRVDDYGFRLIRIDPNAADPVLWAGTPEFPDVPEVWEVEVEGDTIRLRGDGALAFEVVDGTYRGGHIGCWAYQNSTEIFLDEIEIEHTAPACFTASTELGAAPLTVEFDASCTDLPGEIVDYSWDFGDGESASGAQVSHEFLFGGSYMVTLTVEDDLGGVRTTSRTIEVFDSAAGFSDDFSRPDGPVDGWTVHSGDWNIVAEQLTCLSAGTEIWAWAGDPAFSFPANFTLTFTLDFLEQPADAVGRHGGVMFCGSRPTQRWGAIDGYTIDWIDRTSDHGIRLIRVDGGAQTVLDVGASDVPDPPFEWEIVVEGPEIRVLGDGVEYLRATDTNYRNGFFGVWAYSNGQSIAIDDVDVTSPEVSPCFTVAPEGAAILGTELTFDASCSSATGTPITSYSWDFGDGATAEGPVVTHTFATEGVRDVRLTLATEGGLDGETARSVDIYVPESEFSDEFDRADGPVEGWTLHAGGWSIVDEQLDVNSMPGDPESWIWAGDPPVRLGDITSIEFDMEFLAEAPLDPAAVGRHGGVFFFASRPTNRYDGNDGYLVDWIDRDGVGYRLSRFVDGVQDAEPLASTPDDAGPGLRWEIQIDGDTIRLLVDGALKLEAVDTSYRVGYLGFWTHPGSATDDWIDQPVRYDSVAVGGGGPGRPLFHRGDADVSGVLNITDGIFILNFLFLGGEGPSCVEAADTDDSGAVNITDGIYVLNFLFLGGPPPAPPGSTDEPCGPDPEDSPGDLGCESYDPCA